MEVFAHTEGLVHGLYYTDANQKTIWVLMSLNEIQASSNAANVADMEDDKICCFKFLSDHASRGKKYIFKIFCHLDE